MFIITVYDASCQPIIDRQPMPEKFFNEFVLNKLDYDIWRRYNPNESKYNTYYSQFRKIKKELTNKIEQSINNTKEVL